MMVVMKVVKKAAMNVMEKVVKILMKVMMIVDFMKSRGF